MRLILGFIGIVIVLWMLWFFSDGPRKFEENPQNKFIKPIEVDYNLNPYLNR